MFKHLKAKKRLNVETQTLGGMHVLAGGARALVVTYLGFYDWTSRGQLNLMVVRAAVQWFAVRCASAVTRALIESGRWIDLS